MRPLLALALALAAVPLAAATFLVPSDAEMVQAADDVVVAVAVSSTVDLDDRGSIVTRVALRVEESLKGPYAADQQIVLTEDGGRLGDRIRFIPGTPEYVPGRRYLVFTSTNRKMEVCTYGLVVGQFALVEDGSGRTIAVRDEVFGLDGNLEPHAELVRDAAGFLEYIRGLLAWRVPVEPAYFVPREEAAAPGRPGRVAPAYTRVSYLFEEGGRGFRWKTPNPSFVTAGSAGLSGADGGASVARAFDEWNGTESDIDLTNGGTDETAVAGIEVADGKNGILLSDPDGQVDPPALALGGITAEGGAYTLDGEYFWDIEEADVVMEGGRQAQSCYNTVMTHEVGHTLGFRHSNRALPGGQDTEDAIMNSGIRCEWNGYLKDYEESAASTVYGTGPVCSGPYFENQPSDRTVAPGSSAKLFAGAVASSGALSYQWYAGTRGDTSAPIAGATHRSVTVKPAATTRYWVRITDECDQGDDTEDSRTATVTVTAGSCTAPVIDLAPVPQRIVPGATVTLFVTASGTAPLAYQWYEGEDAPVGSSLPQFTSAPLTSSTSFRVHVSNGCGAADSEPAVVSVVWKRRAAR